MFYNDFLPCNVIEDPEVGAVDVSTLYQKYVVQITDAWGKTWFLQTIGKTYYAWTRSRISARCFTEKTAQKYAEIVKNIWYQYVNEKED